MEEDGTIDPMQCNKKIEASNCPSTEPSGRDN